MGRYEDAVSNLQKLSHSTPTAKKRTRIIADAFMKLGRRDEAKQHYQTFLALHPTSSRAGEIRRILQ